LHDAAGREQQLRFAMYMQAQTRAARIRGGANNHLFPKLAVRKQFGASAMLLVSQSMSGQINLAALF
jgi:hypothetical protein